MLIQTIFKFDKAVSTEMVLTAHTNSKIPTIDGALELAVGKAAVMA